LDEGIARPGDIVVPEVAKTEDLVLAHSLSYIDDVLNLRKTRRTIYTGLPLDSVARRLALLNVGGTLLATDIARDQGIGMHLTGGTVYAYRDHAASLSFFNDVAIVMLREKVKGRMERGLVISMDAYFPEGTVSILQNHPDIQVLSVFDGGNRMSTLPSWDQDIAVRWSTRDEEYLGIVEGAVLNAYDAINPDFVVYLSSAMVQNESPEGGFTISDEALEKRDRIVIGGARERSMPIAVLTAGGRTRSLEDYVGIHRNTARVVKDHAGPGVS
jgi:acetoin utilization deacetylase AcuC-like enzyme